MEILKNIAQDIVEKASEILNYPISITDNEGYIIGATDNSRIGIFHQTSYGVVEKKTKLDYKSKLDEKVLPGVCLPIEFNNCVIGVLGIVGGEPGEIEKYGQLVKSQIEMMCHEAITKDMTELRSKMIEIFVYQIIHNKSNEIDKHIAQYSNLLDVDLHTNRVCLLIDIKNFTGEVLKNEDSEESFNDFPLQHFQKEVLEYLNLILVENKDDMISFINIERFILIKSLPFQHSYSDLLNSLPEVLRKLNCFLERRYQVTANLSVGDISHGIQDVSESYRNAKKTMSIIGESKSDSAIHIYNEREIMLQLLPKELTPDYKYKLISLISPLIEHDNYEVLASTITAYCDNNMMLSETSRNMFIHRNTLIYRLERIREITLLNTGDFRHCMLLYTAIQCYKEIYNPKVELELV